MPLDPCRLTPAASLNRVPLSAASPGAVAAGIDREDRAFAYLSPAALAAMVERVLPGAAAGHSPSLALEECLRSPDPRVRRAAVRIAEEYGARVGVLVATLVGGSPRDRAARPEWDGDYWARWAATTTVWLGGGLVAGRLGVRAAARATAILEAAGVAGCRVAVAAHADALPLIGAARAAAAVAAGTAPPPGTAPPAGTAPPPPPGGAGFDRAARPAGGAGGPDSAAVVVDLGHTWVKRAVAVHDRGGVLISLDRLPSVPAPPNPADTGSVTALAESVADIVAGTWAGGARRGRLAPVVVASMAAYVHDGQPVPAQPGTYAALRAVSPNLARWMSAAVSGRLGTPVTVVLVHDGTAAAHAVPPDPRGAVIVLGTALGVGYPHPCPGLAPVGDPLRVTGAR